MPEQDPLLKYRDQHKHRLNYMPWLYYTLKPHHRAWAEAWQQEYQAYLMEMETVEIGKNCFISPLAHIFAEPDARLLLAIIALLQQTVPYMVQLRSGRKSRLITIVF